MTEEARIRGISAVNFHITDRCNYRCGFCFSKKLVEVGVDLQFWKKALVDLWAQGVSKVNFVGGEPLLYEGLRELCSYAKDIGYSTGIVTNGSLVTRDVLERFRGILDWIGFSVDSVSEDTECAVGRHCGGHRHLDGIRNAAKISHELGFNVKLNITVISQSKDEDFEPLIRDVDPSRVKVFRVLKLDNVNSDGFDHWEITDGEFEDFRMRHRDIELTGGARIVFEDNDVMSASYLMLDPCGRFMVNHGTKQSVIPYDQGIRDLGSMADAQKFLARGGDYHVKAVPNTVSEVL